MRACALSVCVAAGAQQLPAPVTPCNMNCLDRGTVMPVPVRREPALDEGRHRLVVLTDMGGDNDDSQSLVRLVLYSNEIDLEGLVATTSTFMTDRTNPELITRVIDAYGQVRSNLLKHDPAYPTRDFLASLIKTGSSTYGLGGVGPGRDSTGSELLIAALKKKDDRPLWVAVWGGANTLAQALWKIRSTENTLTAKRLTAKLRVYAIGDQDDSGPWLRREFPDLFWITPVGFATGITSRDPGSHPEMIGPGWLAQNIQQGHGPLGEVYPDSAYGMEGDTPSFLSLIPNGMNDPSHPDYGGWGGRFALYIPPVPATRPGAPGPRAQNMVVPTQDPRPVWTATEDTFRGPMTWVFPRPKPGDKDAPEVVRNAQVTVWRWREDFQNDFAARMAWTTKPYGEANHPPIAELAENTPAEFTVHSGQEFHLNATGSHDPDHDSISFYWFQYLEAGDLAEPISLAPFSQALADLPVLAPRVDTPKTVHFILRVTDKGTPALSRYRRVIVHIVPSS